MLNLDRRSCKLGLKSSTDGKEIDGTEVKLLTLNFGEISIKQRELNVLLGEPRAWSVLYNNAVKPPEPNLKSLRLFELREPIEDAAVTLHFGENRSVTFAQVTLSKIKLETQTGGDTAMSCKLTATPALDETFAEMLEHLGASIEVELRFEPGGAQQDLPLNNFGASEFADGTKYTVKRSPPAKAKRPRKIQPNAGLN